MTATSGSVPEPAERAKVVRPNGKVYVPRKSPTVESVEWPGDEWGVVVLRTHNEARARALAEAMGEDVSERTACASWLRQSLCICGGGHAWDLREDAERGVPAVEFR